jgi:hypothetical protein
MSDLDPIDDPEDAYDLRQRARDEAYRQAYLDWIGSLPPEERAQLGELGLDRPSVPGCGTGAPSRDMAESSLASCGPEETQEDGDEALPWSYASQALEPAPEAAVGLPGGPAGGEGGGEPDPERFHDLLRRLVGELIGQDNARLSLECLALVTGLAYCGDSMTDIAKRHGVTRAAVSKRCVELTRALHLKPSRAMRSVEARQSYRQARMRHLSGQD